MSCAFMSCALKINSNGGFKRAYGVILFNHEKHYVSTTTMPLATRLFRVVTNNKGITPISQTTLNLLVTNVPII